MAETLIIAVFGVFAASLLRGFTGFGFGIAAVPLLSLALPPTKAVPHRPGGADHASSRYGPAGHRLSDPCIRGAALAWSPAVAHAIACSHDHGRSRRGCDERSFIDG